MPALFRERAHVSAHQRFVGRDRLPAGMRRLMRNRDLIYNLRCAQNIPFPGEHSDIALARIRILTRCYVGGEVGGGGVCNYGDRAPKASQLFLLIN